MTRTLLLLSAAMLLAACATPGNQGNPPAPALGQATQASSNDANLAAADAKPDDLVCTTQRSTGSRQPVKTCYTREHGELRQREGQRSIEEAQRAVKFDLDQGG